jgi:hypothetical protein
MKQKPPFGVLLKPGHPLAKGLISANIMNLGFGLKDYDLAPSLDWDARNHVTLSGGVSWASGEGGYVLRFNGTNGKGVYANKANFNFERTNPFSMVCWFSSTSTGSFKALISKTDGANKGYELRIDQNNFIIFQLSNDGTPTGTIQVKTSSTLGHLDGKMHQIISTYGGTSTEASMNLYMDGINDTVPLGLSLGATILNNVNIAIGLRNGGLLPMNGDIAAVFIYNRELTAEECYELFINPYSMFNYSFSPGIFGGIPLGVSAIYKNIGLSPIQMYGIGRN